MLLGLILIMVDYGMIKLIQNSMNNLENIGIACI